jgi:dihydrofolate synthase/folylpolyglutamate synthase
MLASTDGPRGTRAEELAAIIRRLTGETEPVDPFFAQAGEIVRADRKPGVRAAPRPAVPARDVRISCFDNPVQAFAEARKQATDNDRILVFGSFATVGPVLEALRLEGRDVLS